jgi:hypothetical protein
VNCLYYVYCCYRVGTVNVCLFSDQFKAWNLSSNQIKPDQIKSKRRSLGSKYNRIGARTGHILKFDSDKSPNLSVVIKECLGSNQTRPDQIKASLPRFEIQPTRSTPRSFLNIDSDKFGNLSEVIKECLGSNQTRPDQIQLGSISKTKFYMNTSKYQSIKINSIS